MERFYPEEVPEAKAETYDFGKALLS